MSLDRIRLGEKTRETMKDNKGGKATEGFGSEPQHETMDTETQEQSDSRELT